MKKASNSKNPPRLDNQDAETKTPYFVAPGLPFPKTQFTSMGFTALRADDLIPPKEEFQND